MNLYITLPQLVKLLLFIANSDNLASKKGSRSSQAVAQKALGSSPPTFSPLVLLDSIITHFPCQQYGGIQQETHKRMPVPYFN